MDWKEHHKTSVWQGWVRRTQFIVLPYSPPQRNNSFITFSWPRWENDYCTFIYYKYRPGASKFSTRNNAGEIVAKYPTTTGEQLTIDWTNNEKWEPKIQLHGTTAETKLTSKYNYMFSRLRDKYDVLEEQINNMGILISEKFKIDDFESNNAINTVVFKRDSLVIYQITI